MALQELTVIERQIDVDVFVVMSDVTINFNHQEVFILPAAAIVDIRFAAWEPKGTSFTPSNTGAYELDTRLAAVDIYLPDNPPDGFAFAVRDGYANFYTNFCNVVPFPGSGQQIIQTAVVEETLSLNYPHVGNGFMFRYRAVDKTWSW
jgi:hypothetical protein